MTGTPQGGAIYSPPGSAARDWASGLSWAWGLGAPLGEPRAGALGIATAADAEGLSSLVDAGRLAGAVILHDDPAAGAAGVTFTRREGVARFEGGTSVRGEFGVTADGEPVVNSSLGAHAVGAGGLVHLAQDPVRDWGRLDAFWAYELVHRELLRSGHEPGRALAGIGCLRLDDAPGTALHQLQERAKGDANRTRQLRGHARRLRRKEAVLNVAVVAEGLEDGRRVPLDRVYPKAVRAIREGVEGGVFEPVCHGSLHLDATAWEAGEIEFREFARLDADAAGEAIDSGVEWQRRHLGEPSTFCAPAWAYGPAADSEAARRGLARWHRPRPGPMYEDGRVYETLIGALLGIHGADFSPLTRMAAIGIPPTVAMHGALLDSRMQDMRRSRDVLLMARLFLRRDFPRLLDLDGIRWLSARDYVGRLRAHGEAAA